MKLSSKNSEFVSYFRYMAAKVLDMKAYSRPLLGATID